MIFIVLILTPFIAKCPYSYTQKVIDRISIKKLYYVCYRVVL